MDAIQAGEIRAEAARVSGSEAPGSGIPLGELATGVLARVLSVSGDGMGASVELKRRLAELGFLPGECVKIVARGFLGREPLAVRIGTGTFALRRFEAACIRVLPEQAGG